SAGDAAGLVATFASLHAAATDGLVREVVVADVAPGPGVCAAVDDAGARMGIGARAFAEGCADARQPWLLLLKAGVRLAVGWERPAWRHINDHQDQAGWFRLSLKAPGLAARAEESRAALEAGVLGRPRAEHGLLLPRRLYLECAEAGAGDALPLRPPRSALRAIAARVLA